MPTKPKIYKPTPEEDAEITAVALQDPDNPPWSEEFFRNARRGRPPMLPSRRKVKVTIALDPDVVAAAKAGGAGWQTRINRELRRLYGLATD